ncbi:universal stress protein [Salegentibacter sp. F188]|uniref:Universal stress protein n=1 Tax=Autumnicola patrickiae TaxID=3075591 RepID=A0ABU3DZW7_9FLAO|nr:universal stress protein [Salegentibacter sp. F188]MDT0689276.1 universal stress protein [Salegentibacter sp. F188]
MKKILVPTDFSDQAENALKVAAKLAKRFNSEIHLVHMLELPLELIDPVQGHASRNLPEAIFFMKLAHQRFLKLLQRPFLQDITVYENVHFNSVSKGILEFSKNIECDLIVMGSYGASGFQEMLIGSNTEKIVRSSKIPVLVIKEGGSEFNVEDFVLATDAEPANQHSLQKASEFAKLLGAKLHLLYVNTPNVFKTSKQIKEQLKVFTEGLEDINPKIHIYNDVSIERGIMNFAEEIDAGLIGISTHGRKGIAHFFNGSISEDLVNNAKRPVVTFML